MPLEATRYVSAAGPPDSCSPAPPGSTYSSVSRVCPTANTPGASRATAAATAVFELAYVCAETISRLTVTDPAAEPATSARAPSGNDTVHTVVTSAANPAASPTIAATAANGAARDRSPRTAERTSVILDSPPGGLRHPGRHRARILGPCDRSAQWFRPEAQIARGG